MKLSTLKNHARIPLTPQIVHVVDIDNIISHGLTSTQYDTANTLVIGAYFAHDDGVIKKVNVWVDSFKNAAVRLVKFSGERISDMSDHFITSLVSQWCVKHPATKRASWILHSLDQFMVCVSRVLGAFGAYDIHTCVPSSTKIQIFQEKVTNAVHMNSVFYKIKVGDTLEGVNKLISSAGGKVKLTGCGKNTKLSSILTGYGFEVSNGIVEKVPT